MDHSSADFPLTMDEVKEMGSRNLFDEDRKETFRDTAFSLCAHKTSRHCSYKNIPFRCSNYKRRFEQMISCRQFQISSPLEVLATQI